MDILPRPRRLDKRECPLNRDCCRSFAKVSAMVLLVYHTFKLMPPLRSKLEDNKVSTHTYSVVPSSGSRIQSEAKFIIGTGDRAQCETIFRLSFSKRAYLFEDIDHCLRCMLIAKLQSLILHSIQAYIVCRRKVSPLPDANLLTTQEILHFLFRKVSPRFG